MASAIIPLIAAGAPLLIPLIQSLVTQVETLFPAPKSGAAKMETVLNAVIPVASQLSTAGMIPGVLDPASIGAMIETVVQGLKTQGTLTNPAMTLTGTIQFMAK